MVYRQVNSLLPSEIVARQVEIVSLPVPEAGLAVSGIENQKEKGHKRSIDGGECTD